MVALVVTVFSFGLSLLGATTFFIVFALLNVSFGFFMDNSLKMWVTSEDWSVFVEDLSDCGKQMVVCSDEVELKFTGRFF